MGAIYKAATPDHLTDGCVLQNYRGTQGVGVISRREANAQNLACLRGGGVGPGPPRLPRGGFFQRFQPVFQIFF